MGQTGSERLTQFSHGTLDVALGSPRCIVVATDSRRTYVDNSFRDDTKKLFLLPLNRVVAIAGLAESSLREVPGLTLQIPALLEESIHRAGPLDPHWEDPAPPPEMPDEFRRWWGQDPYLWWNALVGPMQTIFNIAGTIAAADELWRYALFGIVAGYKTTGEPKLERLCMMPQWSVSSWGRPLVGLGRMAQRASLDAGFTWATIGASSLADAVLEGSADSVLIEELRGYEGIRTFTNRLRTGTIASITEEEMVALARDLIRATAERNPKVGPEPFQMAVLRPGQAVDYHQPITSPRSVSLPLNGTWHLGVEFQGSEYPFASQSRAAVFTFCKVVGNRSPIPLDGTFIYGSVFVDALFTYEGGEVHFGDNNELQRCELRVGRGADRSSIQSILPRFDRVAVDE
jgi:hypothetical protein